MNTAEIRYADLVDIAKLQALLDNLHQTIGIANAVIDVDGSVLAHAGWQDVCTKFHRVNPESCQRCIDSDTTLVEQLTRNVPFAVYDCMNGLTDTAAPILVDGRHVANVFTGQFFTAPPDMDHFRQQAVRFGFDETSYLEAIGRVPILPGHRIEAVTRLYAQLAQTLADNGLDRLRQIKASTALAEVNENILVEREKLFRRAIETSADGYWMADMDGRILETNDAYARASGYTRDELLAMRIFDVEIVEMLPASTARFAKLQTAGYDRFESRYRRKDGTIWDVEVSVSYCPTTAGGRMFAFIKDITRRKLNEQALQLTQFAMDNAYVEIYWLDKHARIHYANRQACETMGYTFDELSQLTIPDIDPLFPVAAWEQHWETLKREGSQNFETQHRRKDGSIFPVEVVANYVKFGDIEYNVAFSRDISERKRFEERLTAQANTDYLTGLANRRYFSELVEGELLRSSRYDGEMSVLLLDIDHFKAINDSHGHDIGDLVLQKLAEVGKEALREVDIIGRWGGEEFAVLLPETGQAHAEEVANRLRAAFADSVVKIPDGSTLGFTVSIGIASRINQCNTLDALMIHADRALYEAKNAGRNQVCLAAQ